MSTDLDVGPLQLKSLGIDLEEERRNRIGIICRVQVPLEFFASLLEIKSVADEHLLELCFETWGPGHCC